MRHLKLLLLLMFFIDSAFGQQRIVKDTAAKAAEQLAVPMPARQEIKVQLELYKDQFRSLMQARGISRDEKYYKEFERIAEGVNDYGKVFEFIKRYYGADANTAILYYFFDKDSLTRVFFDPRLDAPLTTVVKIKMDDLIRLPMRLNQAIINNRNKQAVSRGIELIKGGTENLDSLITIVTKLLLPADFNASYRNLVIIPSLNIGTIPFHILRPYKDNSYLIDKCSFTISPGLIDFIGMSDKLQRSLGAGRKLGDRSAKWTLDHPMFVCNPVYPKNKGIVFNDLPGAAAEIDSVKQYATEYTLLKGVSATKEKVLQNIRNSDLAYFATHGIADDADPMQKSFLVLGGENDPFLTARDIMDLRIKASGASSEAKFPEMVILSACQTGLGRVLDAGVIGLARSFMVAGSRHVVMSLWNVDDEATAYLMSRFMWHLTREAKYTPAEPLRMAIVDTKTKYPDPAKWASFSMFGVSY